MRIPPVLCQTCREPITLVLDDAHQQFIMAHPGFPDGLFIPMKEGAWAVIRDRQPEWEALVHDGEMATPPN